MYVEMVLSLYPKGVQGFRGARAVSAGPRRAYSLTFEAARCDVNVETLLALYNSCNLTHRFNKGVSFENKVLFQFDIVRSTVRTHHMLLHLRKGEKEDAGRVIRTRYRNLSLALSAPSKF